MGEVVIKSKDGQPEKKTFMKSHRHEEEDRPDSTIARRVYYR